MSKKSSFPQLVAADEVKSLFGFSTVEELYRVKEIADTWEHRGGNWETQEGDWQWDFYCLLSATYIAGRTQGIREERMRNKERRGKYADAG